MRALSTALFRKMAADPRLVELLSTFRDHPAIFTARPIPKDAGLPIVLAAETIADDPRDIVNATGREIVRDIAVYGAAESQSDAVEEAGELIRSIFHRRALDVPGFHVINVQARGPISAPADADEVGRIVSLTIRMDRVR